MSLQETQQIYDQVAACYDEGDRAGGWRRKIRFQIIERPMRRLLQEGCCLDLGCGTGRLLREVPSQRPNVGMDLSMAMLRKCDLNMAAVCAADAHKLPFADSSFRSVIASNGVFRYLDAAQAFAECYRVLKPGGTLAVHQYSQTTSSWRLKKRQPSTVNTSHLTSVDDLRVPAEVAGLTMEDAWLWRSVRVFPFALPIPRVVPGNHWGHVLVKFAKPPCKAMS